MQSKNLKFETYANRVSKFAKYCRLWRKKFVLWYSTKCDFVEYWPSTSWSLTRFSGNLMKLMILCDSWRWFRSYRRKANCLFANLNWKIQIGDLFFSCAFRILFRRHKENWIQEETKYSPLQRNKQNWMQTKPILFLYSIIIFSIPLSLI